MQLFIDWLSYIKDTLQDVIDLINSNWLTMTMFGINVIYLIIIAVKLKRNTD